MVHKCHLGFCPAILTNKISDSPVRTLSIDQSVLWLANMVRGWTEEMKLIMELMGISNFKELRSRRDLLFHNGSLNSETLHILGIDSKQQGGSSPSAAVVSPSRAPPRGADLWDSARSTALWELAGTTGKSPGEAQISSMGSIGPPFIEAPSRLADWVVTDGAQVTRPSIDPYREEIEIVNYLAQGRIRLAAPFFFTHLPDNVPDNVRAIFARTASSMGLLYDDSAGRVSGGRHPGRVITSNGAGAGSSIQRGRPREPPLEGFRHQGRKRQAGPRRSSGSRPPPRRSSGCARTSRASGPTRGSSLDEDEEESDLQLELSVSKLDRLLIETDVRWKFDILAEGNMVRGSEDIVKLVAMGADCVGFGKAALIAVGFEDDQEVVIELQKLTDHLENLVVAFEKDIKLLAGAAGMSSVTSSLIGNREILRTVGLDPSIRKELGIKPAGAA